MKGGGGEAGLTGISFKTTAGSILAVRVYATSGGGDGGDSEDSDDDD